MTRLGPAKTCRNGSELTFRLVTLLDCRGTTRLRVLHRVFPAMDVIIDLLMATRIHVQGSEVLLCEAVLLVPPLV